MNKKDFYSMDSGRKFKFDIAHQIWHTSYGLKLVVADLSGIEKGLHGEVKVTDHQNHTLYPYKGTLSLRGEGFNFTFENGMLFQGISLEHLCFMLVGKAHPFLDLDHAKIDEVYLRALHKLTDVPSKPVSFYSEELTKKQKIKILNNNYTGIC